MRKIKKILVYIILALFVLGVGGVLFIGWTLQSAKLSTIGKIHFKNELKIPELLEPEIDQEGRKVFHLTFTKGEVEFLEGKMTETWGLNGPYLSPTLKASKGDEVLIHVTNHVGETTTLHWHGMLLPPEMDGGPHQEIHPGETWSPHWTINQSASTTWFHPHTHGKTAEHVYRGVAGMFIIEDEESKHLAIPNKYGVDDIPLIIQDKKFKKDGSLSASSPLFSSVGILGDEILVNGTHSPYFEATTNLVRFRVLNGSNARIYNLAFDDNRNFHLIGTDGGLLEAPVQLNELMLTPGERAEIVVELSPGETVVLQSKKVDLDAPFWVERYNGGDDELDILEIRANENLVKLPALPEKLVRINWPDKEKVSEVRTFELRGHGRINGKTMDMSRIDEVVIAGSTEIWEVTNPRDEIYHNFHVHGVHFEVLEVNGEQVPDYLKGMKDTIYVPPNSKVKLLVQFESYTDENYPYMFHCHILFHEDMGMMGQYIVVEPGANPSKKLGGNKHH